MKHQHDIPSKSTDLSQLSISVGVSWFHVEELHCSLEPGSLELEAHPPSGQNQDSKRISLILKGQDCPHDEHLKAPPRIVGTIPFHKGATGPRETFDDQRNLSPLSPEGPIIHYSDPRFAAIVNRSTACPPTRADFDEWIHRRIIQLLKPKSEDLIKHGLDTTLQAIVKEFGDAFDYAHQLETFLRAHSSQLCKNSLQEHDLIFNTVREHLKELDESFTIIRWKVKAIRIAGCPDERTTSSLLNAAKALRKAAYALAKSQQFSYTFDLPSLLLSPSQSRIDTPRRGDSLALPDGTKLVLFKPLKASRGGALRADALVITPDGKVREDSTFDLTNHGICTVLRSLQPWAMHAPTTKRRALCRQDTQPVRAELVGKTEHGKDAWLFWHKASPFRANSPEITWAKQELHAPSAFQDFKTPRSLRDALALEEFPKELFNEPTNSPSSSGVARHSPPAIEDTHELNGLETLTRLLQREESTAFLHYSGTSFGTSPTEPGFADCELKDGTIATNTSLEALRALLTGERSESLSHALPEIVAQTLQAYPIVPLLIACEESKTLLEDVRTAVTHKWRIVIIAAEGTPAASLASSLEAIYPELVRHIAPDRNLPRMKLNRDLISQLHTATEDLIRNAETSWSTPTSGPNHQGNWPTIIKVHTAQPLRTTSALLRVFDSWAYPFQQELCERLLPYAIESDEKFKEVAGSLRIIQRRVSKIRRVLLRATLLNSHDSAWSLEDLENHLAKLGVLEQTKQEVCDIREQRDKLHKLLPREGVSIGLYSLDEEITRNDLVRISELMEHGRNGIHSATGTLHGMLYGDMSPARFKKFFERGSRIITCRDREQGAIQLFMLYDPPSVCAKHKSETWEAFGNYILAQAIATARDPRTKTLVDGDAYKRLIRTLYLHQIRDGVDFIFGRVHPRNINALIPHMRAGLEPSCIADEMVDGQRFVTMYIDLANLCDDPAKYSSVSLEAAIERAWALFMEEFPGRRDVQKDTLACLTLVHSLVKERLRAWSAVSPVLDSTDAPIESIIECIEQTILADQKNSLQLKQDRRQDIKDLIESMRADRGTGDSSEYREQLKAELKLALLSSSALKIYLEQIETYVAMYHKQGS